MGAVVVAGVLALASVLAVPRSQAQQPPPAKDTSHFAELAAKLAASDPAQVWPAIQELRTLQITDAKSKKAAQQASVNWEGELTLSKDENVRMLRALTLGAAHELGLAAAPALSTTMARDPSARVRLACALALAELGDGAHKAVAKALEPKDLVGGSLACGVFARSGVRTPAASKALKEATAKVETFRALMLSEPAIVCLELAKQDVAKLLDERESDRKKIAMPVMGGLNWGGIVEAVPESFFATFKDALGMSQPAVNLYAVPKALRPAQTQRLCETYAAALGHVPHAVVELAPEVEAGSIATWDDYTKRTQPWIYTLDLLVRVEERFIPIETK